MKPEEFETLRHKNKMKELSYERSTAVLIYKNSLDLINKKRESIEKIKKPPGVYEKSGYQP